MTANAESSSVMTVMMINVYEMGQLLNQFY